MVYRQLSLVMILVVAMAMAVFPAAAEEDHAKKAGHAVESEHHDTGGHHFENAMALFLGGTNEPGHGTEFTIGAEYARFIHSRWAVGGLIDWAAGDQRNLVVAPGVWWRPFGSGLFFLAAPGVEWHNGRGGGSDHHLKGGGGEEIDRDETMFVMRLGVGYAFHVGHRYGVVPQVNLDLVDGHEVWIFGINFEVLF